MSRIKFKSFHDLGSGEKDGFITKGDLCKVNVNWNDDEWNVNINKFNASNEWNAGNRSFFRNKNFPPLLYAEVFICCIFLVNAFFPPAEDFADFFQFGRKFQVLFFFYQFVFPSDLKQVFYDVVLAYGFHYFPAFIFYARIVCFINELQQI
jgi:hypothetical protein